MHRRFPYLLGLFSLLFILHFIFTLIQTQRSLDREKNHFKDSTVQEVMNVIHMVQATPSKHLERAIKTQSSSRVKVDLTDHPRFNIRVTNLTYWRINQLVKQQQGQLTLSLEVPKHRYVNVKADLFQAPSFLPPFFILCIELAIATIIGFYAWSINRFTEPLKQFQLAASRLGINKKTRLEEYKGPRVIRETAQAMNKMQQRIQDLINDRTRLLAAISHDLRTPITRLKLRAHLFADENLTQNTLNDLNEMDSMLNELLEFSRNDNASEPKVKIEFNAFLQTLCDELTDLNHSIDFHPLQERLVFHARKLTLKRALSNLIINASYYGEHAIIRMQKNPKEIVLSIRDQGPGIDPKEFEQVFAPFYRCDNSRSRNIAGTGLGMAIAQAGIRAHNGEVALSNNVKRGLCVTISLPIDG